MSFDISELALDDTPLEGLEQAANDWQEQPEFPPALNPGKHSAAITIREGKLENGILKVTLDLECKGGNEDGEKLNFVRLSGKMFTLRDGRTTSQILDVIKSSGIEGVPKSQKDLGEMLKHIQDTGKLVNFQSDLRTYCSTCASNKMLELTGELTDDAAKEKLKAMPAEQSKPIYDAIRKAAEKHRNYKAIPMGPNGRHVDTVECPTCKQELRVQADVTRWLRPSGGNVTGAVPF
jgi:hypothetical protein